MWKIEIVVQPNGQTQFFYPRDRPVSTLAVMEAVMEAIKAEQAKAESRAAAQAKVQEATPTDLSQFLGVNTRRE